MKISDFFKEINIKNNDYWEDLLSQQKLNLFKETYANVPAYRKFLKANGFKKKVKNISEFAELPVMTKNNYLRKNPTKDLVFGGSLSQPLVWTSTSGSTGDPFYFPRTEIIDLEYSYIVEYFLRQGGKAQKEPTLVLVCFGMGVWIGGVITYQAFEMASRRSDLPVSILTPGINKSEILKALKNIAPNYKNLILTGYPPFIKDIVDEANKQKIDFSKYNTRFIFAAEVFTENFRDYIGEKAHVKNIYKDTLSLYGTADIGAMAWETGALILLKRLLQKSSGGEELFFGSKHNTPTIGYFNPRWLQFEEQEGQILVTGMNAIPFVRYGLGDNGGVFSYKDMLERLKRIGIDFTKEAEKAGLDRDLLRLPSVYVYERSDLSTTLYGLQIYPGVIREALLDKNFYKLITGKFSMATKFNNNQDQYLEIMIEKKSGIKKIPAKKSKEILDAIMKNLHHKNSEFHELVKFIGDRANPKLIFMEYEDNEYFRPQIKQTWVRK